MGDVDDSCGCDVFTGVDPSVQPDTPLVITILFGRDDVTRQLQARTHTRIPLSLRLSIRFRLGLLVVLELA